MAEASELLRLGIRRAEPRDLNLIRGIYNEAVVNTDATLDDVPRSEGEMAAWFEAHNEVHAVLVSELDGEVVGYGALTPFAARGGYRFGAEVSVYVAPDHRRAGVGGGLCRELTAHADASGLISVTALVTSSNQDSRRLFERAGYEHQGCLRRIGSKFGRIIDLEIYQWLNGPGRDF